MERIFDTELYQWLAMVISCTLALVLLLIKVPKTEYAKKLTKSKNTIAINYLICTFVFGYTLNYSGIQNYEAFSSLTMLIVTTFTSITISYSLINLVHPQYMDSSRFMLRLFMVFLASVVLVESFFSGNSRLHKITLYTGIALFIFQSCYLIIIFDKAYKRSIELLEKYYDEDEEHKIKWIRFCYILTMLTNMIVLVYLFLPGSLIKLYTFFFILYMIYFAGNFISFLGSHKLLLDAVGHTAFSEQNTIFQKKKRKGREQETDGANVPDNFRELEKALKKWVKDKKFREYDKSREETARELGTTKEMLHMYFTDRLGVDFRTWRTDLRINEAKTMLLEKKDCSINYVGEAVGFSDRSNFHRQFTKSVGCSPKEWRETDGHPEKVSH